MARMIDADALLEEHCDGCSLEQREECKADPVCASAMWIVEAPTVDAVPVVHGRWEYYSTTMMECSNCKRHTARHKFRYCPHCGAVMEDKYHDN